MVNDVTKSKWDEPRQANQTELMLRGARRGTLCDRSSCARINAPLIQAEQGLNGVTETQRKHRIVRDVIRRFGAGESESTSASA